MFTENCLIKTKTSAGWLNLCKCLWHLQKVCTWLNFMNINYDIYWYLHFPATWRGHLDGCLLRALGTEGGRGCPLAGRRPMIRRGGSTMSSEWYSWWWWWWWWWWCIYVYETVDILRLVWSKKKNLSAWLALIFRWYLLLQKQSPTKGKAQEKFAFDEKEGQVSKVKACHSFHRIILKPDKSESLSRFSKDVSKPTT